MKTKIAIIGSGNIGTDLMIKILRTSDVLEMSVVNVSVNSEQSFENDFDDKIIRKKI